MTQASVNAVTQVFQTSDGVIHHSKAAADAHIAKPKVLDALQVVAGGKRSLAEWLLDAKETILGIYDTGVIRRVTKAEANALAKDIEKLRAEAAALAEKNLPKTLPFIMENLDSILSSFRHPPVARLNPEERSFAIRNSLLALCANDEKLAEWIATNREAIMEAYKAGVVKRAVSEAATAGLKAYQEKKAAEKAAKEAALAAGTSTTPLDADDDVEEEIENDEGDDTSDLTINQ